jgi:hypothetical protein
MFGERFANAIIQLGILAPHTEFLKGSLALSRFALGFRNRVHQTRHAFAFEETGDAGARHVGIDVLLCHEQQGR